MTENRNSPTSEKLGCKNVAALIFVAIVWMLATLLAVARAGKVGWPGLLRDEGFTALAVISLTILAIVLIYRKEIIKSDTLNCPECDAPATQGHFSAWQFVVVICLFPLGLLALLAGRQPTRCPNCNHTWRT